MGTNKTVHIIVHFMYIYNNTNKLYLWISNGLIQGHQKRIKRILHKHIYVGMKQVEEITDEMPTNFQIEIIDRLDKYKDRDLDKAIKN